MEETETKIIELGGEKIEDLEDSEDSEDFEDSEDSEDSEDFEDSEDLEDEDFDVCRICLEEDVSNHLILPCACTQGFCHARCLQKWRRRFPKMHIHRVRCGVCKTDYTISVSGYTVDDETVINIIDREDGGRVITRNTMMICNKWCGFSFLAQIMFTFNTIFTFFYMLHFHLEYFRARESGDIHIDTHILYTIQFFQGMLQVVTYTYYIMDPTVLIISVVLYYYFITYNPNLMLASNMMFAIFSLFRLCLKYDR